MTEAIRRVISYLNRLGKAKYHHHDFNAPRGNVVYASIEFIGSMEIGAGLEEVINNEVNPNDVTNIPASIRFIGLNELQGDGKVRYTAEIIPYSNHPEEMEKATMDFLNKLPGALKNIIDQKRIDIRRVGKAILRAR